MERIIPQSRGGSPYRKLDKEGTDEILDSIHESSTPQTSPMGYILSEPWSLRLQLRRGEAAQPRRLDLARDLASSRPDAIAMSFRRHNIMSYREMLLVPGLGIPDQVVCLTAVVPKGSE